MPTITGSSGVDPALSEYIFMKEGPQESAYYEADSFSAEKYIWVPFLHPEAIKILSVGAIWNFSQVTGLF